MTKFAVLLVGLAAAAPVAVTPNWLTPTSSIAGGPSLFLVRQDFVSVCTTTQTTTSFRTFPITDASALTPQINVDADNIVGSWVETMCGTSAVPQNWVPITLDSDTFYGYIAALATFYRAVTLRSATKQYFGVRFPIRIHGNAVSPPLIATPPISGQLYLGFCATPTAPTGFPNAGSGPGGNGCAGGTVAGSGPSLYLQPFVFTTPQVSWFWGLPDPSGLSQSPFAGTFSAGARGAAIAVAGCPPYFSPAGLTATPPTLSCDFRFFNYAGSTTVGSGAVATANSQTYGGNYFVLSNTAGSGAVFVYNPDRNAATDMHLLHQDFISFVQCPSAAAAASTNWFIFIGYANPTAQATANVYGSAVGWAIFKVTCDPTAANDPVITGVPAAAYWAQVNANFQLIVNLPGFEAVWALTAYIATLPGYAAPLQIQGSWGSAIIRNSVTLDGSNPAYGSGLPVLQYSTAPQNYVDGQTPRQAGTAGSLVIYGYQRCNKPSCALATSAVCQNSANTWVCTCVPNVCPPAATFAAALTTGQVRQGALNTAFFVFASTQGTVAGVNSDFQAGACAGLLTSNDVCVNYGVPQRCPGCPKSKSKKSLLLLLLLLLLLIPVFLSSSLLLLLLLCIRRKKTDPPVPFATFDAGAPAPLAEPVYQQTLQAIPVQHTTVHTGSYFGAPGVPVAPGQFVA